MIAIILIEYLFLSLFVSPWLGRFRFQFSDRPNYVSAKLAEWSHGAAGFGLCVHVWHYHLLSINIESILNTKLKLDQYISRTLPIRAWTRMCVGLRTVGAVTPSPRPTITVRYRWANEQWQRLYPNCIPFPIPSCVCPHVPSLHVHQKQFTISAYRKYLATARNE